MLATFVSRKRLPACSADPRSVSCTPDWIGATTTLMFSSPLLPGGPKAASGSATTRLFLQQDVQISCNQKNQGVLVVIAELTYSSCGLCHTSQGLQIMVQTFLSQLVDGPGMTHCKLDSYQCSPATRKEGEA